jgi:hypothetical protein
MFIEGKITVQMVAVQREFGPMVSFFAPAHHELYQVHNYSLREQPHHGPDVQ